MKQETIFEFTKGLAELLIQLSDGEQAETYEAQPPAPGGYILIGPNGLPTSATVYPTLEELIRAVARYMVRCCSDGHYMDTSLQMHDPTWVSDNLRVQFLPSRLSAAEAYAKWVSGLIELGVTPPVTFAEFCRRQECADEMGFTPATPSTELTDTPPRLLAALAHFSNTAWQDWEEICGPETGVGSERWYRHVGGKEAYICDDQGHVSISVGDARCSYTDEDDITAPGNPNLN